MVKKTIIFIKNNFPLFFHLVFIFNKKYIAKRYYELFNQEFKKNQFNTFNNIIWSIKGQYKVFSYKKITNKIDLRKYIQKKLGGSKHLVPIYKVFSEPEQMDFMGIPAPFVVKSSFFCGDKEFILNEVDMNKNEYLKNKFTNLFKNNYFIHTGEKQYMHMNKHVYVEQYLPNLIDVKIQAIFSSKNIIFRIPNYDTNIDIICQMVINDIDKINLIIIDFADMNTEKVINEKMISKENKKILSNLFCNVEKHVNEIFSIFNRLYIEGSFIRIDFFISDNNIYVGEFTLLDSNGIYFALDDVYSKIYSSFEDINNWKFTRCKYKVEI